MVLAGIRRPHPDLWGRVLRRRLQADSGGSPPLQAAAWRPITIYRLDPAARPRHLPRKL